MQHQKPVQKLLTTEMSRREFLGFVGAATLGVVGVSGLVRGLSNLAGRHVDKGYGSMPYGGGREGGR